MPQMAPLLWFNLFFLFLFSLALFMINNYFSFLPKKNSLNFNLNLPQKKNWKW